MNRHGPKIIRFFFPAVIIVSVVMMVNFYLRSEGAVEIGFLGGDYSAFIGTTIFFVAIVVIIQIFMRRGSRGRYDKMNAFLAAEQAANLSRKRDIDDSLIIKSKFPESACIDVSVGDTRLLLLQDKARISSQSLMMKINMSNIEIKQAFGPQNIDHVARAEANFNRYVQALQEWAEELQSRGRKDAACEVLREAVSVGADTSKVYLALTDIYRENIRRAELEALLEKSREPVFLPNDVITKSKIQAHIESALKEIY